MIGLDTVHTVDTDVAPKPVKIDKDTIITHNLKLEKRGKNCKFLTQGVRKDDIYI